MRSILIAEGDEDVAEVFAYVFARGGWTAVAYCDGRGAAAALADRALFDAVLVSNRLEDMDGVELITRIRALDHRKGVLIVMVTASAEPAIVTAALAHGADDVLLKPVDVATVVDTVNKYVEWGRQQNT